MVKEAPPAPLSGRDRRAQRREAARRESEANDEAGAAAADTKPASRRATRSNPSRRQGASSAVSSSSQRQQRQRGGEKREPSTSNGQPGKKQKTAAADDDEAAAPTGSSSAGRTYNLRSTTARTQAHQQRQEAMAATVTPAAAPLVVRQINFGANNDKAAAGTVPPGVVDLFDERQPITKLPACQCPFDRNVQLDTPLMFAHLAAYGREQLESLREREVGQMDRLSDFFPPEVLSQAQASPASSTAPFGDDDSDSEDDEEEAGSPDSGIVSSSTRSSCGTPLRGALRRFRISRPNHRPHLHRVPDGDNDANNDTTKPLPRQPSLTPRMRGILVNWLSEVALEYNMSDESTDMAVSLLDFILWLGPPQEELYDPEEDDATDPEFFMIKRADFQALGCACAWIASKFVEVSPPSVSDWTYISDASFTAKKLGLLETRICRELNFSLHLVTPLSFITSFLRASHACKCRACNYDHPVLREVSMYLLELGRFSYDLTVQAPSLVAAAAVYLARATLGIRETDPNHALHPEGFWTKTLHYYTGYTLEELRDPVLHIYRYQLLAGQSEHIQGVYQKYRSADRQRASLKAARRIEDLGIIRRINHDDLDTKLMLKEIFHPSMKW